MLLQLMEWALATCSTQTSPVHSAAQARAVVLSVPSPCLPTVEEQTRQIRSLGIVWRWHPPPWLCLQPCDAELPASPVDCRNGVVSEKLASATSAKAGDARASPAATASPGAHCLSLAVTPSLCSRPLVLVAGSCEVASDACMHTATVQQQRPPAVTRQQMVLLVPWAVLLMAHLCCLATQGASACPLLQRCPGQLWPAGAGQHAVCHSERN